MHIRKLLMSAAILATTASVSGFTTAATVPQADKVEARELLEELIPYRTAKGYGQLPAMIKVLEAKLKQAGFADEDIVRVPVMKDGEEVVGLIVRYAAAQPSKLKPVAFLAHMDVVDANPENWETDPFQPTIKDGYLYGRGTMDNKYGVALLVSTFANLKEAGFKPTRDILLAFAGDEETGMLTTREIIKHPFVANAEFALNSDAGSGTMTKDGKGTAFGMQAAEKTFATYTISATNPGGHSSIPKPDNAIYDLSRALLRVEALEFPVAFNEITRSMAKSLAKQKGGELGKALTTLLKKPNNKAAIKAVRKHPGYSNMLWTTCVATMVKAGHVENALPQNADGTVNCRILPGTSVADVQKILQKQIDNDELTVSIARGGVESPASPLRDDVTAVLQKAVALNYPGVTLQPSMSSGGTEGREYRSVGISVYGAGSLALVRPDDSRMHGIDERVPLSSFYNEMDYWDYVIRSFGSVTE